MLKNQEKDAHEFVALLRKECSNGYLNYELTDQRRLKSLVWSTNEMYADLAEFGDVVVSFEYFFRCLRDVYHREEVVLSTISTDGDAAMLAAIANVLPDVIHR